MASINSLKLVSYNMHGFNQGCPAIDELIAHEKPDVILLQEHWLTPANLTKFDSRFGGYFAFGSSAMSHAVESGIIRGRPYGGVMCLISESLRKITETVVATDRYAIFKLGSYIVCNVYLPCTGTEDRRLICNDLLADLASWCDNYANNDFIIAGDFNTNLDSLDPVADYVNSFCDDYSLQRCDNLCKHAGVATYVNEALGHCSTIDYMLMSSRMHLHDFTVLDLDINFSDHLPLLTHFAIDASCHVLDISKENSTNSMPSITQLRWDHSDLLSYYENTRILIEPIYRDLTDFVCNEYKAAAQFIDCIYDRLVHALNISALSTVPVRRRNFYKFWWDQELDSLKDNAISSNKVWKSAGRPRSGPLFTKRNSDKRTYKLDGG